MTGPTRPATFYGEEGKLIITASNFLPATLWRSAEACGRLTNQTAAGAMRRVQIQSCVCLWRTRTNSERGGGDIIKKTGSDCKWALGTNTEVTVDSWFFSTSVKFFAELVTRRCVIWILCWKGGPRHWQWVNRIELLIEWASEGLQNFNIQKHKTGICVLSFYWLFWLVWKKYPTSLFSNIVANMNKFRGPERNL